MKKENYEEEGVNIYEVMPYYTPEKNPWETEEEYRERLLDLEDIFENY